MNSNRLQITSVENKKAPSPASSNANTRRQEIQAKMERMWRQDPEQFSPFRDCMQRQRFHNTVKIIKEMFPLSDKRAVDLGCAAGDLTRVIRDLGAKVDAVDAATLALQHLKNHDMTNITPIHDCLPSTHLPDDAYDLVVCTEVIGYLFPSDYRLGISELSRIIKSDGLLICSSELDINTTDPVENFALLAETEFEIEKWTLSHHMLLIRLLHLLETPAWYIELSKNSEMRRRELEKKRKFGRLWLKWNTTIGISFIWKTFDLFLTPLVNWLRQSTFVMNGLEKICRFLWNESGISHALFIGKRRPLIHPIPANEIPKEPKHKRMVWE
jgi:2-polyprenyl-3-methyl-5-hydroxy-6-metoxy-1,4-benzoquinol methylase